jgi:hypothetical protein
LERKPMKSPQLVEALTSECRCGKSSAYMLISSALEKNLVQKLPSGELAPVTKPAA